MTATHTMKSRDRDRVPRALLLGVLALVLITLAGVTALRLAGAPLIAQPPAATVAERVTVVLERRSDGGVDLRDPAGGAVLATLEQGRDGFLRGLIRVLGFERGKHDIAGNPPVSLIRWDDGRYSLSDPSTGWRMEFQGFGQENLATVARLMSDIADRREVSDD